MKRGATPQAAPPGPATRTVADATVTVLRDWGLRYVFGVSGANIEHLHDAIHRLGRGRLTSVLARREDGAAFMADGHARVHRTLGVCCSTSGGALVNLAVGLAESYAESVPVLALVGQPPQELAGKGAFQDGSGIGRTVDARRLLSVVTKHTTTLTDPERFWDEMAHAARTALSGRPGPVALLLPRDVFERTVPPRPADWPSAPGDLVTPPEADPVEVRALFDAMRRARRPVVLLGHGVRRSADREAVVEFARAARIPVAVTMSARAEFPNSDPLYLGVAGAVGHPSAHAALREADLVVAIGAGLNAMTRGPLGDLRGNRVAVVNVDPGEASRAVSPALVVRADAGVVARRLLALLREQPFQAPELDGYRRTRYRPRPARRLDPAPSGGALRQSEAITTLAKWLPAQGHLVLDAGNCASAAIHLSDVPGGASSTIALGAGGMGYSIGAAVGIQLGSRAGSRTVVICGDGAFLMNGLEVHTAVDLRLPILYVVFNNAMHGMCVTRQQTFFDARIEAVRYAPVDIATVARGLGGPDRLWVASVDSREQLDRALADYAARAADVPAGTGLPGLLDLRISQEEVPPFVPFLPLDEPTFPVDAAAVPAGRAEVRV
ncbi:MULTISPECIES: thiamine pyrophosphate-binding protein [Streptomycetaceae]|uniref:Acetolactate synthase large subunit n=1 Tax=Streptantibioticus cattleyicolor (strain ATCC 35852 / DSM 46488 / JCM 4925 / NBRC 14057 / NRRL 8057) TaxID=1003195 RepID=F8K434_STREN|nr:MULTISPECIES: thiamine pyrophosphate-binding protein [Streptomycetaceae]AEW92572.1 acetolactate synthase large subunit [Streptantibioticus cattleyicolor NRRL 8057 = DSM 46488]MYS57356.1 thiamine pyrophosphate-binding protein [Streptomyces sp. SID5468]CCB72928.1 Acetolactate synthase large subunit [Streptantibioticus cattleyicolor NRRL 8057 = DSM 46488]